MVPALQMGLGAQKVQSCFFRVSSLIKEAPLCMAQSRSAPTARQSEAMASQSGKDLTTNLAGIVSIGKTDHMLPAPIRKTSKELIFLRADIVRIAIFNSFKVSQIKRHRWVMAVS